MGFDAWNDNGTTLGRSGFKKRDSDVIEIWYSLTKVTSTSTSTSTHGFNSGAMATREVVVRGVIGLASCINLVCTNVAPNVTRI